MYLEVCVCMCTMVYIYILVHEQSKQKEDALGGQRQYFLIIWLGNSWVLHLVKNFAHVHHKAYKCMIKMPRKLI